MARAYGDDLRIKFLSAYDRGEGTLEELAGYFGVSLGWGKKISSARKRSGRAERTVHRPGRKLAAGESAQRQVMEWVAACSDLTLGQLQIRLEREAGVKLSRGRVWYLLKRLGLRLKKSRSTHRNETRKKTASGANSTLSGSARSRRRS